MRERERPSPNLDRSRALMSVAFELAETGVIVVVVVETCNHFHAGDKETFFSSFLQRRP